MAKSSNVVMRVASVKGKCPNGHKVGDAYHIGTKTPEGVCIAAFSLCMPYVMTLRHGGEFPWVDEAGTVSLGCPDTISQVTWRLERSE